MSGELARFGRQNVFDRKRDEWLGQSYPLTIRLGAPCYPCPAKGTRLFLVLYFI